MNEQVYESVRRGAGMIDRSDTSSRLVVRGRDRASWLQGLLTNDIAALRPGQGCYAAYLSPQGRMLSDMRVLAFDDALLLDVPRDRAADLLARFELFVISEDVQIDDATGRLGRVGVHGPASARMLATALRLEGTGAADASPPRAAGSFDGPDWGSATSGASAAGEELTIPPEDEVTTGDGARDAETAGNGGDDLALRARRVAVMPEHAHVTIATELPDGGFVKTTIVAANDLGLAGFDLYVPADSTDALMAALRDAGALTLDAETADVLRVEAGVPRFGVDMDEHTIPLEAGIESRAISFTKGCYVGQEVIVRVRDRGQGRVARKLVGLAAEPPAADDAARRAAVLARSPVMAGDREVGRVTSAVWSPALARTIALGYVARDVSEPGTRVSVRPDNGQPVSMVVVETPFIAPAGRGAIGPGPGQA